MSLAGESDSAARPDWVAVALLGKPRGIRGELTAVTLSDKPERFDSLTEVFLFRDAPPGPLAGERFEVEEVWFHRGGLVFKFRGIDTIPDATRLVGAELRVPISERAPLDPGEFFQSDLIGCEVFDLAGHSLGPVRGWEDGGGPGLLVLEGGLLIPFARSICVVIDPAARRIVVELPEGLEDLNRK